MEKQDVIKYLDLPLEKKREIQEILKRNTNLPIGFYSVIYIIMIENQKIKYRLHAKEQEGQKAFSIIFAANTTSHKPYPKGGNIHFFDKSTQSTLHISKNKFYEIVENEVDFNLSVEQKELLAQGHEITLSTTKKSLFTNSNTDKTKKIIKTEMKSFIADYSYFLGKTSLILKEILSNNLKFNLKLTK